MPSLMPAFGTALDLIRLPSLEDTHTSPGSFLGTPLTRSPPTTRQDRLVLPPHQLQLPKLPLLFLAPAHHNPPVYCCRPVRPPFLSTGLKVTIHTSCSAQGSASVMRLGCDELLMIALAFAHMFSIFATSQCLYTLYMVPLHYHLAMIDLRVVLRVGASSVSLMTCLLCCNSIP